MKPVSISTWACVALFACAALPLCISNYDHGRAFADQAAYHYPAIVHFARGGGLSDYPSATTPGFHLLLAGIATWVSESEVVLKLANFAITASLLGLLASYMARQLGSAALTVAMVLPMIFSIYVLPSGVWLLPDNLAWLSVLCVFALALSFRHDWHWYLLAALALMAAVLIRQTNLWLCLVTFAAAWGVDPQGDHAPAPRRLARLAAAALATVPAVTVLAYFVSLWHGLTPPAFAEAHTGVNLAVVPFFLALLCFYSLFYLPLIAPQVRALLADRRARNRLYLGGVIGLLSALITPTDWNPAAGRVSGLWNLARMLPDIGHRSLTILLLATLGGMLAVAWMLVTRPRTRLVVAAAGLGFVLAQSVSHFVYERYYAGLLFLLILLMTADVLARSPAPPRWSLTGPALFTLFNAGVLGAGLLSG